MIPGKWISSIQAEAQLKFNEWNKSKNTVVLDTETTGLHGAEIVEIAVVDLDGNKVEGDLKPSTDTPTHLVLYRAFKDIGGIVHTHSSGQVLCPGRKRHTRLWRSLVQIIQKETTTIDRKLKNSIRT